jgi:multidrug resistance efflux pump
MQVQFRRIDPLAEEGAISLQERDRAQAARDEARSTLADARAALSSVRDQLGDAGGDNPEWRVALAKLESAELQLSYTKVTAPVNGYVTNLDLSVGSFALPGTPMLSLVDTDSWRVVAYLKETQLRNIRPGQPARVYLPAYPDVRFDGRVQGIGWGIEPQDGTSEQGGLPTVSPTVDWVRMAQRFPVRITLVDPDPAHPLRKGMRASVRIDATGEAPSGDGGS